MLNKLFNFFFRYEQGLKKSAVRIHHKNFEKETEFIPMKARWADILNGVMLNHNQQSPYLNIFVSTDYNCFKGYSLKIGGYYPFAIISERPNDLRMLIFRDATELHKFCDAMMDPELCFDTYMGESISKGLFKVFRFKRDSEYLVCEDLHVIINTQNNKFIECMFGEIPFVAYKPTADELFLIDYFTLSGMKEENYFNYERRHMPDYIEDYKERINEVKVK